jgi:hypothetical protein
VVHQLVARHHLAGFLQQAFEQAAAGVAEVDLLLDAAFHQGQLIQRRVEVRIAVAPPGLDDQAGDIASRLGYRRFGAGVHAFLEASGGSMRDGSRRWTVGILASGKCSGKSCTSRPLRGQVAGCCRH